MTASTFSGHAVDGRPFFTAIDPDARIKGSRDPLGFESLWTSLGRKVVGNLTTVTESVRQFSTLLFGFYFADKATESFSDRDRQFLAAFLRFEQLAAYARYTERAARRDIRGIRAVTRNIEHRGRLCLSPKLDWQILSDQKSYGIYGLFRMAARSSGLLQRDDETRLTPAAREHVERQLENVNIELSLQKEILARIARDSKAVELNGPLVKAVSRLLRLELSGLERNFYGSYLVRGRHLPQPFEAQERLWECMETASPVFGWDSGFSMPELQACIHEAGRRNLSELEQHLGRIRRGEELLGAAAMIYDFLLTQDKQRVDDVAQQMAGCFHDGLGWLDVANLVQEFGQSGGRLTDIAQSLKQGNFAAACRGLLEQNAAVMRERGGSAWIVLKDERLDVRFLEEGGELPTFEAIRHPWVHTYFLNALKRIGGWVYHGCTGRDENGTE